jgi:hypothetical protein
VLTVAANGPLQIFLGPVDTLLAVIARPRAHRAANKQQDCQDGNQLKALPTIFHLLHTFLLNRGVFGTWLIFAGFPFRVLFQPLRRLLYNTPFQPSKLVANSMITESGRP